MICTIRDVDCCAHTKSLLTQQFQSEALDLICMYIIVHILVWTYLFLLTSFFDCLSFCRLFLKHPYKRFFPFYILYFYPSRFFSLSTDTLDFSLDTHSTYSFFLHTLSNSLQCREKDIYIYIYIYIIYRESVRVCV